MKKLFVGCLSLVVLASCNVKNSDEYKRLQAERDSLMQISAESGSENTELMSIIDEVEANFSKIKETEKYLTVESNAKGEMSSDTRSRIKDDFTMISEILKKNKESIDKLNQRIKSSGGENSSLKKMVERLNNELSERAQTISELQSSLSARDAQIAKLQTDVKSLVSNVESLTDQTVSQASVIKDQDKELNSAYYMFGTARELKEAKVVSGGLLASLKILNENIEKSKFIRIDIRETHKIPLYSKKAKILSEHPKDSYTLEKDADGKISVNITDYKRFWSIGKFLIIEVN